MTPEQIREAEAIATLYEGYAAGLRALGLEDTTKAAFAAQCIRACIEAWKCEDDDMSSDVHYDCTFITGEPT